MRDAIWPTSKALTRRRATFAGFAVGRVRRRALASLALASLALSIPDLAHADAEYPFRVESAQLDGEHRVTAHNRGPAPISLRVELQASTNASSDRRWPVFTVVPPYREIQIARVFPADPAQGYRFGTRITYILGDFTAAHDPNARYRMPYEDGRTFLIGQAPDGPLTTHTTPESRFAIDIMMPEGTPVLAAREGTVIATESGNTSGGKEESLLGRANHVRILHGDGTVASYAHLAPGGVTVTTGQRVLAGAQIGLAGSTGYSSGPHLHFSVSHPVRTDVGFAEVSVPFQFHLGNPAYSFAPLTGLKVTADYSSAGRPPPVVPVAGTQVAARGSPPTDHTVSSASREDPGRAGTDAQTPATFRAFLLSRTWWEWLALLVALWLIAYRLTRSRRFVPAAGPSSGAAPAADPVRRTRAADEPDIPAHCLSTVDRLVVACLGDRGKASRLMEYETRRAPRISDEEAAARALDRLKTDRR